MLMYLLHISYLSVVMVPGLHHDDHGGLWLVCPKKVGDVRCVHFPMQMYNDILNNIN